MAATRANYSCNTVGGTTKREFVANFEKPFLLDTLDKVEWASHTLRKSAFSHLSNGFALKLGDHFPIRPYGGWKMIKKIEPKTYED